jgi:alcohol dehydrogenase YqhD (iron-dependent ADH family)
MKNFVYNIPTKVYFGENQLKNLHTEIAAFGKKVLLTYGGGSIKKSGLYDAVKAELDKAGMTVFELSGIEPNPRISSVRKGAELCKKEGIDVLLAVGGGSTIDATKWMAAGACVDHDPWEFFSRWTPVERALPVVSVLTLAATGSEMNGGGVISNPETQDKIGRVESILRPKVSFLDPTATYSVSRYQTACGSADIFSHILEVYFAPDKGLDMVDGFMESMLRAVIKYAPIAMAEPCNYEARANLMWASSWAINGFVAAGKSHAWSCHPMEHELSAIYDITHGLGLAILTPRWMKHCLSEKTVGRFAQYAINVFGVNADMPPMDAAIEGIKRTEKFLFETLGLDDTFTKVGIGEENLALMANKACGGGVIPAFVPLSAQDIESIFRACL